MQASMKLGEFTAGWEQFTAKAVHFAFDPAGVYQDRWAPDRIRTPIVDHLVERRRKLALYRAALG